MSNYTEYTDYIWDYFTEKIGNEYGVAGMMGNLQAESGCIPYRKQGDFTINYSKSLTYTKNINNGSITEYDFVHDSIGYGLAQWTYYTRKQNLYDKYKSGSYSSIGDIRLGCDMLWSELQGSFSGVLSSLQNATSVKQASDAFLHDFEKPLDQSEDVERYRASIGQDFYDHYKGIPPKPPDPDPPQPEEKYIPIWLLKKMSENK